jgi:hypothetical protein
LPQGLPQIAVQHDIGDPAQVLIPDRTVEPERVDQLLAGEGIGADVVLTQHEIDHVAGHQAHDGEHDDAGEE